MILKFIKAGFIIIFLYGCGYSPIFSNSNNTDLNISITNLEGDKEINNLISQKLSKYKKANSEKNYNIKHKARELIKDSFYSIPEFNNKYINKYRIISNPGCYPTSIQLPLVPLILNNLIRTDNITIDSKSGYSGAGKNLKKKFTHKNLYTSTFAYSTKYHRHICEIDQQFKKLFKKKILFSFNPHLLPTFRGILTSIYVHTKKMYRQGL